MIGSISIAEIPEKSFCIKTRLPCEIDRTCLIITNCTGNALGSKTFIFSQYPLYINTSLRRRKRNDRIFSRNCQCFLHSICRIIWIRDSECYCRIKRKFHISWIAFCICSNGFKNTCSEIPMTYGSSRSFHQKIHLTNITSALTISIETALNDKFHKTQIHPRC